MNTEEGGEEGKREKEREGRKRGEICPNTFVHKVCMCVYIYGANRKYCRCVSLIFCPVCMDARPGIICS